MKNNSTYMQPNLSLTIFRTVIIFFAVATFGIGMVVYAGGGTAGDGVGGPSNEGSNCPGCGGSWSPGQPKTNNYTDNDGDGKLSSGDSVRDSGGGGDRGGNNNTPGGGCERNCGPQWRNDTCGLRITPSRFNTGGPRSESVRFIWTPGTYQARSLTGEGVNMVYTKYNNATNTRFYDTDLSDLEPGVYTYTMKYDKTDDWTHYTCEGKIVVLDPDAECSNSRDDDDEEDTDIDEDDSGCWTDPEDPTTYDPTDDDETYVPTDEPTDSDEVTLKLMIRNKSISNPTWGSTATLREGSGEQAEMLFSPKNASRCEVRTTAAHVLSFPTKKYNRAYVLDVIEPSSGDRSYTIRCDGNEVGDSVTKTVRVEMIPNGTPPPTYGPLTLTADPERVRRGQVATLEWKLGGRTQCNVTGNGQTISATSDGDAETAPILATVTYSIACDEDNETKSATIMVIPAYEEF